MAQTLLDALELEEQKFLARLSVFRLPVREEIVRAISTTNELTVLGKFSSLSLVESATTHLNQPANYQVTTILEPLLEPVLTDEEWQSTRQQAVRKIHQAWWEENEQSTVQNRKQKTLLESVALCGMRLLLVGAIPTGIDTVTVAGCGVSNPIAIMQLMQ
ncbi:hypothetical protein WA1_34875 [Scytonema hofmannii PCC 7110]|uniref:Uncharacterized protein n=1 Tax=Scytonema hofmannii PCC 7110 TaxID=128403 RepID=A0A139X252_9CYAN|nr:hypothetical protein [Scytonema hofmannii]KYC38789.1 hypothetical protein WA1_34875 [Scytonema hofmannii PCC 7110]